MTAPARGLFCAEVLPKARSGGGALIVTFPKEPFVARSHLQLGPVFVKLQTTAEVGLSAVTLLPSHTLRFRLEKLLPK